MEKEKLRLEFHVLDFDTKNDVFNVEVIIYNLCCRDVKIWNFGSPFFINLPGWELYDLKNKSLVQRSCKMSVEARHCKIDNSTIKKKGEIRKIVSLSKYCFVLKDLKSGKYKLTNNLQTISDIPKFSEDEWKISPIALENKCEVVVDAK